MSAFRCLLKTLGDRGWWGVSKSCSCSKLRRRFYFLRWNSGLTGRVHLETWDLFFLSTLRQVHITLGHLLQCLILPLIKSSVLHNWKRENRICKLEIAWFPRTHSSLERCQVSKHCLKVARNKFQSVTNCSQFSCFQCFHLWFHFKPFFWSLMKKFPWFSRQIPKNTGRLKLYEKSLVAKSADCGGGSPQWDSPHSKLSESERKVNFEEICWERLFFTPTFIQGPRHDLNTTKCYEIHSKVNILSLGVNLDFDTRNAYKKFNVNLVKFYSLFWELGWFVGYNIQITKTLPKKASSFICWQNVFLHSYAPLYTMNCAGCSWEVESPMPKWTFSLWN